MQATLKIRNSNFYSVAVTSLSSEVQYMNTVVGSYMTTNISHIPPRSEHLVCLVLGAWPGCEMLLPHSFPLSLLISTGRN